MPRPGNPTQCPNLTLLKLKQLCFPDSSSHIHSAFSRNSGAQVAHRPPCTFLCLCSRYHVRVTYERLLSCKILCPRRLWSGCAQLLVLQRKPKQRDDGGHRCSLKRLQRTMQPNRNAQWRNESGRERTSRGLCWKYLHLMIFSAYVVAAQNDFC